MPATERGTYLKKIARDVVGISAFRREIRRYTDRPDTLRAVFAGFSSIVLPFVTRQIQDSGEPDPTMSEQKATVVFIGSMASDIGIGLFLPLLTSLENPVAGAALKIAYNGISSVIFDARSLRENTPKSSSK